MVITIARHMIGSCYVLVLGILLCCMYPSYVNGSSGDRVIVERFAFLCPPSYKVHVFYL